ncbi:MAG: copper chaperone PCu(A)C [Gracilimonas sp.]|uniref:copper chaperone PCu(A)C n=1 Tax=Gracilimonas sp. TaxID=1974203 RepID=UPI0037539B42|nr:copper chaperone PCu(A)C [Gracilimonas sp.]
MRYLAYFLTVLVPLVMISCGAEKEQVTEEEVVEERVRPAASGGTSAAYFSYSNTFDKPDTLISVNSAVARLTQIHESYETEDGMTGMRERREVIIPAGENVVFKQGGLHVMMMDLRKDLSAGDSVGVELELKLAGRVSRLLPVQP